MNNSDKTTQAIRAINPNAEWHMFAGDLDSIQWTNDTTPISKSDIEVKMAEIQTEYDNKEYSRNRSIAYPSLQEFAEAYCEKEIGADTTKWDEYVIKYNKVRTDNPK